MDALIVLAYVIVGLAVLYGWSGSRSKVFSGGVSDRQKDAPGLGPRAKLGNTELAVSGLTTERRDIVAKFLGSS